MAMKNQDVYELMARFEASAIARLRLVSDDTTLELEKAAAYDAPTPAPTSDPAPTPAPTGPAPSLPTIDAPIVGTFYAAAAPGEEPFVAAGDLVKEGAVVCLLEAMKMMSEVCAPCDCVIEEVVATDGELVSFGAPLLRYRKA